MSNFKNAKPALLSFLIVIGLFTSHSRAHAGATEALILAGGCFWCVEADFESVPGVIDAVSGFTGGTVKNPTYKQVTRGKTGHYEAVKITFDPSKVSRDELLQKFLRSIDPLDAAGQFCDRGANYRSAIFYSDNAQKSAAKKAISKAAKALNAKIATPVLPAAKFYPAGDYHQDYYKGNKLVLTRFGPKRQAQAYLAYRKSCGRDARVKELWGNQAPFVHS